jgi:flagellar hook-length control protein FliK
MAPSARANSAPGRVAGTALSNTAPTSGTAPASGGTTQATKAALAALPAEAAAAPNPAAATASAATDPAAAASTAADPAAIAAAAATAEGATTPQGAKATAAVTMPQAAKATAPGDGSYDSNAAVGSMGAAGASDAAGATVAPLSAAHAAASISALAAANLSVGADSGKHAHTASDIAAFGSTSDAAAGLSQLSSNSPVSAPADAAPAPTLRIHASVDGSDFPQGLSDRVSWMVGNGMNGARLQVNPPQLGPIELRISVQGDHAQVWMTTHSAVTRDALEASSPKLREMLGAQGFGQVSVDISQRSFQDRSAYTPRYERAPADRSAVAAPAVSSITTTTPRTSLSALDAYA